MPGSAAAALLDLLKVTLLNLPLLETNNAQA